MRYHERFIHHERHSPRYPGWDYSAPAGYFLTICTHGREYLFGEIRDGGMVLNNAGHAVEYWWRRLPSKFPNLDLDRFVIMPNHFHGIVWLMSPTRVKGENAPVGTIHELSLPRGRRNETIPKMIGYFKMNSAKQINLLRETIGARIWQRSYHDRIIRNRHELTAIRAYIQNNPSQWTKDEYARII